MFTRTERFHEFIRYYPIITGILLIQLLFYLMMQLPIFPNAYLFEHLAGVNLYIANGELWRLVTPIFLHSGFAHLLFNSFTFVIFGPALERILGKTKFALVYLATGVLANLATFVLKPLTYVHVGSSGALFGLFGVYLAMVLFRKNMLSRENSQMVLIMMVLGVVMTLASANVNVTAHLFGLLSGLIIGSFAIGRGSALFSSVQHLTKRSYHSTAGSKKWSTKGILFILLIVLALIGLLSR